MNWGNQNFYELEDRSNGGLLHQHQTPNVNHGASHAVAKHRNHKSFAKISCLKSSLYIQSLLFGESSHNASIRLMPDPPYSLDMLRVKTSCADGFQMPTGVTKKTTEATLKQWKMAKTFGEVHGKIHYPKSVNMKPILLQFQQLPRPLRILGIADKGNTHQTSRDSP